MAHKKNLVSLEEHNATIQASVHDWMMNEPRPNGVACPKCAQELVDVTPNMVLQSLPPKKAVRCQSCGWRGERLA